MSEIWFSVKEGQATRKEEANRVVGLVNLGPSETKVQMQDGEDFIVQEPFEHCIDRIREAADD